MIEKQPYTALDAQTAPLDAGTVEIEVIDPEADVVAAIEIAPPAFGDNLAETLDESVLHKVADSLCQDLDNDRNSRKDWEQTYIDGLKLLGLKHEDRTEPWAGACGVVHPMITEAVVRFQADLITETFPARGPVLSKIIGKETPEKKAAAQRVQADMNFQLTEEMTEYRPEHEKMLWSLPAAGSAFKKVYFDPSLGRPVSLFVPAEDILLPYGASNIESCYRVTHVMRKTRNELVKLMNAGFYRYLELSDPGRDETEIQRAKDRETGFTDLNDERYILYECHVDLDLEGYEHCAPDGTPTGIALPYVVTILKDSGTVLSIRRNWREEDPQMLKRQHFVHYQYVPGFGAYGFGLFHLIGGYAKSATSLLRQLVDAGTLSNVPGGLKARGLRIRGDDTPIAPGEFRDVDVGSGSIRDNILPLPYKEPSQVLALLMNQIIDEGRRFAATADVKISDMSAQAPVGTTLALLERQLKVMSAVQARVHFGLKQEFKLLKSLIADYVDENYEYEPHTGVAHARQSDYRLVDVIPVSDPNAATMSQRVIQYQAVIQLSQTAPHIYDMPQLHRGMLEVLGIKNVEKLVPIADDAKPVDPVTENMAALRGQPLKAFLHQDHEAHIQVHTLALQDPLIAQLIGQNPKAGAIMAAAQAHIAEHVAFAYRQRMEAAMGLELPDPEETAEEGLPKNAERQMSRIMAQAAQAVLQQSQERAQEMQAQANAQDPVVQMQLQDMQIKLQRVQIEQQRMQIEAAAQADQTRLAETRLQIDAAERADKLALEQRRLQIDAAARADKMRLDERKLRSTEELGEHKLQVDALRVGTLSRAADATIRQRDQELAVDTARMLREQHDTNRMGESGV